MTLPPDDPYRQLGDTLYTELYAEYAADLAVIPAPANLTTFDLAVIFALQQLEHLTAGDAAALDRGRTIASNHCSAEEVLL